MKRTWIVVAVVVVMLLGGATAASAQFRLDIDIPWYLQVSLSEALRYSTAVGAQNVRVLDTVSGTKSWKQTTEQIRKRPTKTPLQLDMSCWRWVGHERHYVGPHDGND